LLLSASTRVSIAATGAAGIAARTDRNRRCMLMLPSLALGGRTSVTRGVICYFGAMTRTHPKARLGREGVGASSDALCADFSPDWIPLSI
jgi:hypothetical protein